MCGRREKCEPDESQRSTDIFVSKVSGVSECKETMFQRSIGIFRKAGHFIPPNLVFQSVVSRTGRDGGFGQSDNVGRAIVVCGVGVRLAR